MVTCSSAAYVSPELPMGWVDPQVRLGWVGNRSRIFVFSGMGWVMGHGRSAKNRCRVHMYM